MGRSYLTSLSGFLPSFAADHAGHTAVTPAPRWGPASP